MNTEQKAFKHLKQQDKYHLEWEAQRLSGEAERGELSQGQHTYRRRLKQVLHQKHEQSRMNSERQIRRSTENVLSPQARYDQRYDQGKQFLKIGMLRHMAAIFHELGITDRLEREGFEDGYYGFPRSKVG